MARAAKRAGKRPAGRAAAAPSRDAIIDSTLALAAERGWGGFGLADVAAALGVTAAQVAREFPTKTAVAAAFFRRVDDRVLAGVEAADADESARERLFDVLMRRFDALNAHRDGVRAVVGATCRDPVQALCALPRLVRAATLALAAAGLDADGAVGRARARVLALIYANALRTWLADDTPDMARTMAVLDRGLAGAERLARLVQGDR